jgi:hypothetical protein
VADRTEINAVPDATQVALGRLRSSAGDLVEVATAWVPEALASRRALAEVGATAAGWPSLGAVMLEVRLSAAAAQVDLALGTGGDPGGRAFLATWCASASGPADASRVPDPVGRSDDVPGASRGQSLAGA